MSPVGDARNVTRWRRTTTSIYEGLPAWSTSVRDEASAHFLAAARRLASSAAERGDHERTAQLARRIIDIDPYDEAAHRLLVEPLEAGRFGTTT